MKQVLNEYFSHQDYCLYKLMGEEISEWGTVRQISSPIEEKFLIRSYISYWVEIQANQPDFRFDPIPFYYEKPKSSEYWRKVTLISHHPLDMMPTGVKDVTKNYRLKEMPMRPSKDAIENATVDMREWIEDRVDHEVRLYRDTWKIE